MEMGMGTGWAGLERIDNKRRFLLFPHFVFAFSSLEAVEIVFGLFFAFFFLAGIPGN